MSLIQEYSFGRIRIDDETFTSDVIIYPDRVTDWWREDGHYLQPHDIPDVLAAAPDVLVVGTGHSGIMRVAPETEHACVERGIEIIKQSTVEAVRIYNELVSMGDRKVIAALHLTC